MKNSQTLQRLIVSVTLTCYRRHPRENTRRLLRLPACEKVLAYSCLKGPACCDKQFRARHMAIAILVHSPLVLLPWSSKPRSFWELHFGTVTVGRNFSG